jgi:hypothetical protein
LKDEAVIAALGGRGALEALGPEVDAGIFESPIDLLGAPDKGELVADDGPVVTADDGGRCA